MSGDARSEWLGHVVTALRELHKVLLDEQAKDFGAPDNPFQLLHLAADHPEFAWLRELSAFMGELDACRDGATGVTREDVVAVKAALKGLIGPGEAASAEFRKQYVAAMQRSPAVAMAHAKVRQLLAAGM